MESVQRKRDVQKEKRKKKRRCLVNEREGESREEEVRPGKNVRCTSNVIFIASTVTRASR